MPTPEAAASLAAGIRSQPSFANGTPREALLARTLVDLAHSLVGDFDVVELLTLLTHRCVEVLDVAAAGLMLVDPEGVLRVVASSSDELHLVALFEVQSEEGPGPDCYRSGEPAHEQKLDADNGRWPRFGPLALEAGFRSVHALPLRLRGLTAGALNLFRSEEGPLGNADVVAAQALADVATMAILQHCAPPRADILREQLNRELDSRSVIQQASGILAERAGHHRLDIRRLLEAVEGAPAVDAVDVLAAKLREMVDASHVSLLIVNYSGKAITRLSHVAADRRGQDGRSERAESIPLPGSIYEQVLFSQELAVVQEGGGWLVLVPVTERGDAIGLLELFLPHRPDRQTVRYLVSGAHALAYVLIASRRHTDVFELAQRDLPFSLAAEMQRRLLPSSYTIEGGPFTVAGWLEPACTVGGDTFDYSVDREYLYASITDAMGHSNKSALLATLAVGSFRNSRRSLASPAAQADIANAALLAEASPYQFVTGQLMRVRLADGVVELVNAGHPPPYRLRAGRAVELDLTVDLPLGIADTTYHTQEFRLEAGDRLLLVTDGFLDRNAVLVDLPKILEATATRHPREVVRELADDLLDVADGNLRDDATVLCLDWYGPEGQRNAIGGASRERATGT